MPYILWIELTSKCPYDCVFCSRKTVRGAGEHMDFAVFRGILAQLERPRIIRLNYSGESAHYPHLVDAVRLAKTSGAFVELVSAFSAASREVANGLVDAGLDRLSVSLHTVDEQQYRELYGFGSLAGLRQRLAWLRGRQAERGVSRPLLDFAFVAMERNLDQLAPVLEFVSEAGGAALSIHPVIDRDLVDISFPNELDAAGGLRPQFADRLERRVEEARAAYPRIAVEIARPMRRAAESSGGAATCEQNPWETIHILANGDVVACEVQDHTVFGNLTRNSLAEVWHGDAYRRFRDAYVDGSAVACKTCVWKRSSSMVRGWYDHEPGGVSWSRPDACLALAGSAEVLVRGILPPGDGAPNRLSIQVNGRTIDTVWNRGEEPVSFETRVTPGEGGAVVEFETSASYSPQRSGHGADARELGFALVSLDRPDAPGPAPTAVDRPSRLADWLGRIDGWSHAARRRGSLRSLPPPRPFPAGLSVLIPARDNPALLGETLRHLRRALEAIDEPYEVILVVNGTPAAEYGGLSEILPAAQWCFHEWPMGFSESVRAGLARSTHAWVYLLNSDAILEETALAEALARRAPDVFSVASRIELADAADPRTETNRTVLHRERGLLETWDVPAHEESGENLYAGGGASLFQTDLLRRLAASTTCYSPFYWEDVDWGVTAWRNGYRNLFCGRSRVWHKRQATIRRFYSSAEVRRITERNRLLFHLRNIVDLTPAGRVSEAVHAADPVTQRELLSPAMLARTAAVRFRRALLPRPDRDLLRFER